VALLLTAKIHEEVTMQFTQRARISALALLFFFFTLSLLPALAVPPCRCNICQRHPDKACRIEGTTTTCLEFLIVALCPPLPPAKTAADLSSEAALLAALSAPTQEPAAELSLAD
jgi:hypothetical protein